MLKWNRNRNNLESAWRECLLEREHQFRNKITWFTFLLSILVVWVHSANGELFLGQSPEAAGVIRFERFLGGTMGQIAVPGFFMMSGYLFYRDFCWEKLGRKWNSRIQSVLVPFFLWNGIYYLGYVIGSRLPVIADIVEKGRIPFDWYTAVEALIHYTYNYVFWYLYQLILLILLAPVLYGILKNGIGGALCLIVLFYLVQKGVIIPCLNLDALFYYSLAAYGGLHNRDLVEGQRTERAWRIGMAAVVTAIIILSVNWPGGIRERVIFRTLMPVGLWFITEKRRLPEARQWMKDSFYLYTVHFALVRLINKTAASLFPGYWPLPVGLFIFMPVMMVVISSVTGAWIKKQMPKLWFLLNGGR